MWKFRPTRLAAAFGVVAGLTSLPAVAADATPANAAAPLVKLVIGTSQEAALQDLFDHPEAWAQARAKVGSLLYADHAFTAIPDDRLRTWFGEMGQWGMSLELEVGAIKEWGKTGNLTFGAEAPVWDRLIRLNANLSAIAMDEPLVSARFGLKQTDEYAVEETARFIGLVRQKYPNLKIGDIETYPSLSVAENMKWIASLQKRLAELHIKPLDFYRLDVDWAAFGDKAPQDWAEVKTLENYCQTMKLPFSLIYWAADYPRLKQAGSADAETWYNSLIAQGAAYAKTGAIPDQYVIESWVGVPTRGVPETDKSTFTASVRDFSVQFIH